ncbi:unknown [Prevotella sp. CAG:1124]|nr:unknown [Prevotella sp. CAG:1124]
MKEFLMSTTLPFWLVFIIVAAAFATTFLYMKSETKSRTLLFASAGCMLAATVLEIAIYAVLGGNSMWWCTSDEYGFWSKLVRLIPFALFIAMQILQVFFFKGAVEEHIGKELAIKSTFICLILTFPVALVLSIILGVAGVSNETLNVVVSIVFFALVLGGIGWALMRNVRTAGWRQGAAFTAFSVICVVAVCLAVFLFIVALIELFLQILTASVIVIAGIYAYSLMSKGQQVEQPKMMFRDKDGHLHVDSISRDNADKKIDERRENNK